MSACHHKRRVRSIVSLTRHIAVQFTTWELKQQSPLDSNPKHCSPVNYLGSRQYSLVDSVALGSVSGRGDVAWVIGLSEFG